MHFVTCQQPSKCAYYYQSSLKLVFEQYNGDAAATETKHEECEVPKYEEAAFTVEMHGTEVGRAQFESLFDSNDTPIRENNLCLDDNTLETGTSDNSTHEFNKTFYDLS